VPSIPRSTQGLRERIRSRTVEQWSDEISPAPRFRPIEIAEVVQVCRRTISGFCGRRPKIGDSQTLDFATLDFAGLRIFDKNGIEAKSLADDQRSIAAPHLGAFRERFAGGQSN